MEKKFKKSESKKSRKIEKIRKKWEKLQENWKKRNSEEKFIFLFSFGVFFSFFDEF